MTPSHNPSFNPTSFEILRNAEQNHFWFQCRRRWIRDTIYAFSPPPAKILEIGCGTGNVSSYLSLAGYDVTGCDPFEEALSISWPGFSKVRASGESLPFESEIFDVVGFFDVLEHVTDESLFLKEAHRVLKNKGLLIITVPARTELWSSADEISHHKRRYSTESIKDMLCNATFSPLSLKYMFMMLYLPMRLSRRKNVPLAEHFRISRTINFLSMLYFECERLLSAWIRLPIGTSIIAVAKKMTVRSQ